MSAHDLNRSSGSVSLLQSHIDQARQAHLMGEGSLLECLGKQASLDDVRLMQALSEQFNYPSWSMDVLRDRTVRFDTISFTDAAQRGVVLVQSSDGRHQLVLSNPFDGRAEEWAVSRCRYAGIAVAIVLAGFGVALPILPMLLKEAHANGNILQCCCY